MVPIILISSQLYGRKDMSGRSPNKAATVAQQQDAPEIIVPIIPHIIPVPVFQLISARFQYLRLLYSTAIRKRGNPTIIITDKDISV